MMSGWQVTLTSLLLLKYFSFHICTGIRSRVMWVMSAGTLQHP